MTPSPPEVSTMEILVPGVPPSLHAVTMEKANVRHKTNENVRRANNKQPELEFSIPSSGGHHTDSCHAMHARNRFSKNANCELLNDASAI